MRKYIIIIFLLLLSFCAIFFVFKNKIGNHNLIFLLRQTPTIDDVKVNSIPAYSNDNNEKAIYAITLNTLYPNEISILGNKKTIKLSNLNKDSFIRINMFIFENRKINFKTYRLYLLPNHLPDFTSINSQNIGKGYMFTSFLIYDHYGLYDTFLAIIDTDGNWIYYRLNQEIGGSICNLKKWSIENNKILYSYHQNLGYPKYFDNGQVIIHDGQMVIMDSKFNIIDTAMIQQTEKHPAIMAEEHESIVIDKGHYIMFGYYTPKNYPAKYAVVIQEVKDKKVVFDWDSSCDDNELQKLTPEKNKGLLPVLRVNAINIDNRDGNLVISFRLLNKIVKIDRKTGKILWQLGGLHDDFNLPEEYAFTRQHNVHYEGDKLVIYDNIPEKNPNANSRVLKFLLDEKNYKILNVEEIHLVDRYSVTGSVQTLENGNMIIGCGASRHGCVAQLMTPESKLLWSLTNSLNFNNFRVQYFKKAD